MRGFDRLPSVCYSSVLPVSTENPFVAYLRSLRVGEKEYGYYDVKSLGGEKFSECFEDASSVGSFLLGRKYTESHWFFFCPSPCSCSEHLPYSIRVLLESAVRNCDGFQVTQKDIDHILDWTENQDKKVEIPFHPARVILQDFTYVSQLYSGCVFDGITAYRGRACDVTR